MSNLHVLYALDNNYAPYCGVSMTSLFENNKAIDDITVHVIAYDISAQNCEKMLATGKLYHREVIIYDATQIVEKIKKLGMVLYRGSYATNIRLFFADVIDLKSSSLLYLDSDTLVVRDLSDLIEYDFDGCVCAAVQESLGQRYKKLIGFAPSDAYFNAGVLLINLAAWKETLCTQKILDYLNHVQAKLANNDQDVINIVLKNQIAQLSLRYNFQPTHIVYDIKSYNAIYTPINYYSDAEIETAVSAPAILHTYRFIGQFPWHEDTMHPNIEQFDFYLLNSCWKDYEKNFPKRPMLLKIEKCLYQILPKRVFLWIFAQAQYWYFYRLTEKLKKSK